MFVSWDGWSSWDGHHGMPAFISHSSHADLSFHFEGITELAPDDSSSCDSSGEESDLESSDSDIEDAPPQSEFVTNTGMLSLEVEYEDVSQSEPNDLACEKETVSKRLFPIFCETGRELDGSSASTAVHKVKEDIENTRHSGQMKRKLEEREESACGYQVHKALASILLGIWQLRDMPKRNNRLFFQLLAL